MAGTKPSAKSSGRKGVPQPHGGILIPGAGGGPQPGSGRPPDEFKAMCRELVTRTATWKAVEEILEKKDHPQYMSALKWASEQGYGKPKETVEHQGEIRHGVIILPPVMATVIPKSAKKHGQVSA